RHSCLWLSCIARWKLGKRLLRYEFLYSPPARRLLKWQGGLKTSGFDKEISKGRSAQRNQIVEVWGGEPLEGALRHIDIVPLGCLGTRCLAPPYCGSRFCGDILIRSTLCFDEVAIVVGTVNEKIGRVEGKPRATRQVVNSKRLRTSVLCEGNHVGRSPDELRESDFQPLIAGNQVEEGLGRANSRSAFRVCHLIRFPMTQQRGLASASALLLPRDPLLNQRHKSGSNVLRHIGIRQAIDKSPIAQIDVGSEQDVLQESLDERGKNRVQAANLAHSL